MLSELGRPPPATRTARLKLALRDRRRQMAPHNPEGAEPEEGREKGCLEIEHGFVQNGVNQFDFNPNGKIAPGHSYRTAASNWLPTNWRWEKETLFRSTLELCKAVFIRRTAIGHFHRPLACTWLLRIWRKDKGKFVLRMNFGTGQKSEPISRICTGKWPPTTRTTRLAQVLDRPLQTQQ
jgi:hypothetical protein